MHYIEVHVLVDVYGGERVRVYVYGCTCTGVRVRGYSVLSILGIYVGYNVLVSVFFK